MTASNLNALTKPVKKRLLPLSYRLHVLYRFILAIFGGYALAVLISVVVSLAFPSVQASAVMSATMLAFIAHCGVFIWTFMVNSVVKASLGVFVSIAIFAVIYMFLKG